MPLKASKMPPSLTTAERGVAEAESEWQRIKVSGMLQKLARA
jgi:hypothetical protein